MNKIFFLLLFLFFSSCSKDYLFNKNQENISKQLKDIVNADQTVRNYNNLINIKYKIRDFETVCDSLYEAGVKGNLNQNFDFSTIPSIQKQVSKFSVEKQDEFYSEKKKGIKMMNYIDNVNKEKIYYIIRKYGYPSFHNRKWNDTINNRIGITAILTHFNYESKKEKEFLKLMLKEYFAGRVEKGEMKHFMWNVDGRNGRPYDYILDDSILQNRLKSL